jgi:uncharacterized protein (DUF111 family)
MSPPFMYEISGDVVLGALVDAGCRLDRTCGHP